MKAEAKAKEEEEGLKRQNKWPATFCNRPMQEKEIKRDEEIF
jgi:hypothetical protein